MTMPIAAKKKMVLVYEPERVLAQIYQLHLSKNDLDSHHVSQTTDIIDALTNLQPEVLLYAPQIWDKQASTTLKDYKIVSKHTRIIVVGPNAGHDLEHTLSEQVSAYIAKSDSSPKQVMTKILESLK
jgi:DNA-binding NtrC family response regulator